MINYPYNTSFLMPVPAKPIEYACMQAFNDSTWEANVTDTKSEIDLWTQLKIVTDVYFNYENVTDYCFDYSDQDASGTLAADGWNVLACA